MGFDKNPFKKKYTDADGHPIDKHGNRIDVEVRDVPMYRAYGVHKKFRPWIAKLNEILALILVMIVYVPIAVIALLVVFVTVKWSGIYVYNTIATFFWCVVLALWLYFFVLKIPRKRIAFYRKLKKTCKKNGYRITYQRGFFRSLFWAKDDQIDLTVKAGRWIYYVKFFGSKNLRSDVTLCSNGELIYRKLRLNNKFTVSLGLKPKTRKKKIIFPKYADGDRAIKAIILNPVPNEVYKRHTNGDTELSGNEDTIFGYTVYTGTGFIEAICRNAALGEIDMKNRKW